MGADYLEWLIFEEEYYTAGAPKRVNQNGIFLLGPTIMEYGTPEQKTRFLPKMAASGEIWAQGWSEPNAGSDMANIQASLPESQGSSLADWFAADTDAALTWEDVEWLRSLTPLEKCGCSVKPSIGTSSPRWQSHKASSPGQAANADADLYGEPCRSGGPSGSICHQPIPASPSREIQAWAAGPRSPMPNVPGSDVGCSKTPAERSREVLCMTTSYRTGPSPCTEAVAVGDLPHAHAKPWACHPKCRSTRPSSLR